MRLAVVALNRAAAVAEAARPRRALELVDSLELGDYRYLHSTRAELAAPPRRQDEARAAFEHALRLPRRTRSAVPARRLRLVTSVSGAGRLSRRVSYGRA